MQALGERQAALEQSQERARHAFRNLRDDLDTLRTRVQELEQVVGNRITPSQRRTIYDLVHAWGHARAERDPRLTPGKAIHACWAVLTARFGVTSYVDLPAAAYPDCVTFLQEQYTALTGTAPTITEQAGLDL